MGEYLLPHQISGAKRAHETLDVKGMELGDEEHANLFTSIAFGKDVYLSCHRDEDSMACLMTCQTRVDPNCPYSLDDPIVQYFCFPEYGVKVAMRPGDKLVFNPQVLHCLASPPFPGYGVYSISLYTKSAVIGGNDKNKQLSMEEKSHM